MPSPHRTGQAEGETMTAQAKPSQANAFPPELLSSHDAAAGALRWYAAHVPQGREEAFAEKCRRIISNEVLEDCFFPKCEKFMKRHGSWVVEEVPLFSEYFFLATRDVRALAKELATLSFPVLLIGGDGRSFAPLAADAQTWLAGALDGRHVLRASTGVIEDGALKVQRGPLRGREADVRRIDRHKRMAYVGLGGRDGSGGFTLRAALNVPQKS